MISLLGGKVQFLLVILIAPYGVASLMHMTYQQKKLISVSLLRDISCFFWGFRVGCGHTTQLNRKIPAVSTRFQGHVDLCTSLDLHSIHPIDEPFEGSSSG